jgi:very-short-patch-repair endonuclease
LTDFNVDLEIDGSEHKTIEKLVVHDKERNEALLQNGISVVRIAYDKVFSNEHIFQQLEALKAFLKTKNNTHAIHYIE